MKKLVVYTCISGGYDNLIKHKYINPDCDYVCFTDNEKLLSRGKSGPWEIRPLAFDKMDNVRNSRWHKTHPHILFPDYEQSMWIDGGIDVLGPQVFNAYKKAYKKSRSPILLAEHLSRDCAYQEFDACIDFGKDSIEKIDEAHQFVLSKKMPEKYGLAVTRIMFRRHLNPTIIKIDEQWWDMIKNHSRRDQLSFTYVLWKNKIKTKDVAIIRRKHNDGWYTIDYVHDPAGKPFYERFGIEDTWDGHRQFSVFGKKIFSWTPRSVKKDLLLRYKRWFNWAEYSLVRKSDGIHIEGNGLHIVGTADNTLWTAKGVLQRREYNFDTGREDWMVIDIGLNIGISALYFARRMAVKEIYAFEPFKPTMSQARKNMRLNPKLAKKIKLFDFGLSDHDETLSLPYNPKLPGAQSSIKEKQIKDDDAKVIEKIKLRRASDVLRPILTKDKKRKIMMKIDCEGAEREIIPDLAKAKLLGRVNNIIMEYHDGHYKPLVKILKQNGFNVKVTDQHESGVGMIKAERLKKTR